ncbi:MAG: hypothetical protein M1833_002997 [Piccolia ochrophora]|nr:MAG: hypothetical protein M1833_002997 [Piccolia ochrophora]
MGVLESVRARGPLRSLRPLINQRDRIATAQKMIKACNHLSIPIHSTTQSSAKLGPVCNELSNPTTPLDPIDKTRFSMFVPPLSTTALPESSDIAIVGIETHICVTQTALDLLRAGKGHRVYVLADGVSSCNRGEVGVALRRLAREGAVVTTSESWLYECLGDAGDEGFKEIAKLVKDTKESTRDAVETLCKM